MTETERSNVLQEASEKADMLTRVERNINDTLNRIERSLNERIARHESDDARVEKTLLDRLSRQETESNAKHASGVTERAAFETRLRALEDTKMKGSGAWWVLGAFLALVASVCCIVVANTALDEIRSVRQQLWTTQTIQGRKP